jgi:hypothetical protein
VLPGSKETVVYGFLKWFRGQAVARPGSRRRVRPELETLEMRDVPSVSFSSLGGPAVSSLTTAKEATGIQTVFAIDLSGSVWAASQPTTTGPWSWHSLGGSGLQSLAVGTNTDGRLELFAIGTGGALWHNAEVTPAGAWVGWSSLGGASLTAVTVGCEAGPGGTARLAAFVVGAGGVVSEDVQTTPGGGYGGFINLGGAGFRGLAAGNEADGRLQVFAIGADGAAWHSYEVTAGQWSGWSSLGGSNLTELATGNEASGRLDLFAVSGGSLWEDAEVAPGSWGGFTGLGGAGLASLAVGYNTDGKLDVFASSGGVLGHDYEYATDIWSGWSGLGGSGIRGLAWGTDNSGHEDIVSVRNDNTVWLTTGVDQTDLSVPPGCAPATEGLAVSLVAVGRSKRLLLAERCADSGEVMRVRVSPFQRPRFKRIAVITVDVDGDGVADHLLVTAFRNGKKYSAALPA